MKHIKHTPVIVVIMALISFGCLSLSVSYSYVARSKVSKDALVISNGELTSSVIYTPVNYSLSTMDDLAGVSQDDYGVINISKDNTYSVFYTLNIGYEVDSLPAGKTVADLIPMEYIKVALFPIENNNVSTEPIIGPVRLSDITISSINADSIFRDLYYLDYGIIEVGEQDIKYAVKAWIDEETPEKYDDNLLYLGVSVNQEPLVNKTISNLSGSIVDSSGATVDNATVRFHNGKITSELDENQKFTLPNVPTGTYNISVVADGNEYSTTIHINQGDVISVEATNGGTGENSTYLQNSAYTYYTSPGSILKANNLTTTTNQLSTSTYAIPNAYVLTVRESLSIIDISNLVLTLNADYTLGISL